jgi:hypothetical protein
MFSWTGLGPEGLHRVEGIGRRHRTPQGVVHLLLVLPLQQALGVREELEARRQGAPGMPLHPVLSAFPLRGEAPNPPGNGRIKGEHVRKRTDFVCLTKWTPRAANHPARI